MTIPTTLSTARRSAGITATAALLALSLLSAASAAETLRINPQKTRILFEVDAVGWPTTKGTFKAFQGSVTVDFKEPAKSAVSFVVQSGSVDAGSASVTSFIRSESMLNTGAFPEMRFRSTAVEKLSESAVRVTGNMTFMGQTRPASFQVDVDQRQYAQKQLRFSARGTIRRSDFGFISGQPLISDDVRITVTTEAEAQ
jgi:polyisoprenoid-binding protein YceI